MSPTHKKGWMTKYCTETDSPRTRRHPHKQLPPLPPQRVFVTAICSRVRSGCVPVVRAVPWRPPLRSSVGLVSSTLFHNDNSGVALLLFFFWRSSPDLKWNLFPFWICYFSFVCVVHFDGTTLPIDVSKNAMYKVSSVVFYGHLPGSFTYVIRLRRSATKNIFFNYFNQMTTRLPYVTTKEKIRKESIPRHNNNTGLRIF